MERYVGIDLGVTTKHKVTVFDGPNQVGNTFSIKMDNAGIGYLLKRATKGIDGPVNFVFEPTNNVWLPMAALIGAEGHSCFLIKTQKSSDFRKFFKKYVKSDRIDAGALAMIPQIDPKGIYELEIPCADQTTLKHLVKRRDRYVSDASKQKQRIWALLLLCNPFLAAALGDEKFGKATVEFLKTYVDPEKVVSLGEAKLKQFWHEHSKGQADEKRASKVFDACMESVSLYKGLRKEGKLPFDYQAMQQEICEELEQMENLKSTAQSIERQGLEIYKKLCPQRVLEQLKGVGPIIAMTLIAFIGDISRFSNIRKFVSFCGLCPRKKQSGTNDKSMKITKAGQSLLKKCLYLAADVARHWDPDFAQYYARRYARGDHHDYIIVALARKMAIRVYVLLKRYEEYKKAAGSGNELPQYKLRTPDGGEVDAKKAREIIKEKYTREVVAPQRAEQDRRRRNKKPKQSENKWPPKDATSGVAPASSPKITTPVAQSNSQNERKKQDETEVINRKSEYMKLSDFIDEYVFNAIPNELKSSFESLLKNCEQTVEKQQRMVIKKSKNS